MSVAGSIFINEAKMTGSADILWTPPASSLTDSALARFARVSSPQFQCH